MCSRRGCDPCHIKSKGSGGPDEEWNLIGLCRNHHIESHKIGWFAFCEKYPSVMNQLMSRGWKFENQFGVIKLTRGVENESNEVGL